MYNRRNRLCGIYKISVEGQDYVGLSTDIAGRWASHISLLEHRTKTHHSKLLQMLYDEYGPTSLQFSILEVCEKSALRNRERYWIKHLNAALNSTT